MADLSVRVGGKGRSQIMGSAFYALPSDRSTLWQPGVTYNGGIPNRTTIYTTITSTGDSTDRRATIQSALDSCPANQVVKLGVGDFYINGQLLVPSDNITLRGTRVSATTRTRVYNGQPHPNTSGQGPGPYIGAIRITKANTVDLGNASGSEFAALSNLTANGNKGDYTITVANASLFSAGQLVRIDELSLAGWRTDPRDPANREVWASSDFRVVWQSSRPYDGLEDFQDGNIPGYYTAYTVHDRPTCEMKEIASVNTGANTVTFTTPLHISYRTANTARIGRYNGSIITGASIEDITAYGFTDGTFSMMLAKNCWVSGCEADFWHHWPFRFMGAFRCEIRKSIQHGTPYSSNSAESYAFIYDYASADCLVEDCISHNCNKVTAARAAGAGCVFGYNYLDCGNIAWTGADDWVEVGANASHLVGPHHVLFEGNLAFNADSDYTHGNTTHVTHFRNWYRGFRDRYVNLIQNKYYDDWLGNEAGAPGGSENGVMRCAGTNCFGYWHSFVNNVLGMSGRMSGWELENVTIFDSKSVWMPGWAPTAANDDPDPNVKDAGFAGAMIRDGNFDYLTGLRLWHGKGGTASSSHTTPPAQSAMPDSYYCPSKPAFFGNLTWPWVTPEGSTKTYTLPAYERWLSGNYFDLTASEGLKVVDSPPSAALT